MSDTKKPDPTFIGKLCVYCGKPSEGNYAIHRDGFGIGPEVPLCDEHGSGELPSCEQIWDKIRMYGVWGKEKK